MAVIGQTQNIVPEVISKLNSISNRLGKDVEVSSGRRQGGTDASPHNSGIGADIKIAGMKTVGICDELVAEGFTGVGEYYDTAGNEFNFAHGDIRGLPGSESSGAYAAGGSKSNKLCWWREGTETSGTMHYGSRKSGRGCP